MIEGSGHSGLLRRLDKDEKVYLKRSKARIITSISVPEEKKHLIDWAEKRAKLDGVSRSDVLLAALEEYRVRHLKGNPQTMLMPPQHDQTIDEEKERWRDARERKAIMFLRFKCRLSYRQIAKVSGRSRSWIFRFCKELEQYGRPRVDNRGGKFRRIAGKFEMQLTAYQRRFRNFVEGRIENVEDAFRWI